ncbi:MAG: hypothetical protein DMD51_06245 [Gemmatimonadetes bacterium]|nr:MAG: hypothetical protein DMD32_12935 [Gemmatimonadota bacterium]PYP26154.1 MAG: hypothetical protein DMD51_06245 [Gemmatimonadota bacterium]
MSVMHTWSLTPRRRSAVVSAVRALAALGAVWSCSSLLDVKNPNNVNVSDLDNPAAAPSIANGAFSAVAYAYGAIMTEYATVTDELTWIGSRDGFRELDVGTLTNPTNEFTDAAFPYVGRARWMADFAIKQLAKFDTAKTLKDRNDLARSYLYGAIIYAAIADAFNNFPIGSDMRTAAPPVGKDKMDSLYTVAIAYATDGLAKTDSTNLDLLTALLAVRARAQHAKAVWKMLHPPGPGVPYGGALVNDAGANADATTAIRLQGTDWRWRFYYSTTTVDNYIGAWVNGRQEMRIGDRYIKTSPADTLHDLINPFPVDPEMRRAAVEFKGNSATQSYGPLTALSTRELHLILAEAALATADTAGVASGFATHLNVRRVRDGLPPYDPSAPAHPRTLAMLQYERQVNLFLQNRRLQDLYRFGIRADVWQTSPPTQAVSAAGTTFPITQVELLANPYCAANPSSC